MKGQGLFPKFVGLITKIIYTHFRGVLEHPLPGPLPKQLHTNTTTTDI